MTECSTTSTGSKMDGIIVYNGNMKGDEWEIPNYGIVQQTCNCELSLAMIRVSGKGPDPGTDFVCPKCGANMPYIRQL